MKLLALDTSTQVLSIAVQRGEQRWTHTGAGGAQASATLIPALMQLLSQAQLKLHELDAIVFGAGPGSFTGLRTACAVAQGLGLGAGVPLLPVCTLLALAQQARLLSGASRIVAALDARMDEVYCASYDFDNDSATTWADAPCAVCAPEALALPAGWLLAGNAVSAYGARLPVGVHLNCEPCASALLDLAPALLAAGRAMDAAHALPVYVRDNVAQTTAQRLALAQANQRVNP